MLSLNRRQPRTLEAAEAINEDGRIVGWGKLDGSSGALLLTPQR